MPSACSLRNSSFNAAGVLSAAYAWSSFLDRKQKQLLWLVPVVLLSAWLETNLNTGFAGASAMTSAMYKHLAIDVAAFAGLALVFVWMRRKAAFSKARTVKSGTPASQVTAIDTKTISDSELRQAVGHFLASADRADVASLGAIYDNDFLSVRIADDGGLGHLNREQMLSFLDQAVKTASNQPAKTGHAAVQTRETKIHHAELTADMAFVLMTRVKDIGNGWEPMFYNLVWKKQDGHWRLLREFVYQKSTPQWS